MTGKRMSSPVRIGTVAPISASAHRYAEGGRHSIAGYSDHFFSWCDDLNGDGQQDILVVGMPGEPAYWYEHPGAAASAPWKRHLVVNDAGGESPAYIDLNGDGRRDLVCVHEGKFGFAIINSAALYRAVELSGSV